MAQKLQKLSQNAQYLTAFDIIQLKKSICLYVKRIGWPVSSQFGYQIAKQIPNIFE